MKIFISWSGTKSRMVAEALRDWLQDVVQTLKPWMSTSDIEKGARWQSEISAELEESQVGIICLTRENMGSAWLLFEAGALSKTQQASYVCTFLIDVERNEVREPLAQFQSTKAEKPDVLKLIKTINSALGEEALTDRQLERSFERAWPELEKQLNSISQESIETKPAIDINKVLEEILGYVRTFSREGVEVQSSKHVKIINAPEFTSEEIVLLGKILSANPHLNIEDVSESRIEFLDGTHGTTYKINRRALPNFLRRLRSAAKEQKKSKQPKASTRQQYCRSSSS
jgi:hypothetical protein